MFVGSALLSYSAWSDIYSSFPVFLGNGTRIGVCVCLVVHTYVGWCVCLVVRACSNVCVCVCVCVSQVHFLLL